MQLGFVAGDRIRSGSRLALTGLEDLLGTGDELLFPLTDLVGVQLEFLRQLGKRFSFFQGFNRHFCLEGRGKFSSRSLHVSR
ncbi:hypothetical protein NMA52_17380 [Lewinella sp. JB7]|nr:hypothetical protein [Lewinella sp. JB7]MCP9237730.1 hypothetical protein [Lewinella sp. JB7]